MPNSALPVGSSAPPEIGLAALDHIVINARTDMDRCESQFKALGFRLTPRGYHSLGSINALMIFEDDYLELLGLPPEKANARPELSNAPLGLNGVVFKTSNADDVHAHLQRLGIEAAPPKSFSRPVTLADGTEATARFRTVTLPPDMFPAGRLYFCEHQTPELVWRPEWQVHPNRTDRFRELVVVAHEPGALAARAAKILGGTAVSTDRPTMTKLILEHDFTMTFLSSADYVDRFGGLGVALDDKSAMFAAVVIKADCPEGVLRAVRDNTEDFELEEVAGEVRIKVRAFNTLVILQGGLLP